MEHVPPLTAGAQRTGPDGYEAPDVRELGTLAELTGRVPTTYFHTSGELGPRPGKS